MHKCTPKILRGRVFCHRPINLWRREKIPRARCNSKRGRPSPSQDPGEGREKSIGKHRTGRISLSAPVKFDGITRKAVVNDADCRAAGPGFESQRTWMQHWGALNSRRSSREASERPRL
ncbi:hypothetical protein TNCV_427371 [Trichonephila clavipes]|nr:hypothetical protein TNCV_427371 [Trichonephila clavipes]